MAGFSRRGYRAKCLALGICGTDGGPLPPDSRSAPRLCQHDLEPANKTSRRHTHIHDLLISHVGEIGHLQIESKASLLTGKGDVPNNIGTLLEPLNDSKTRIQDYLAADLLSPVNTSIVDGVVEQ